MVEKNTYQKIFKSFLPFFIMKELKTNILVLSLLGLVAFGVGLPLGIFVFPRTINTVETVYETVYVDVEPSLEITSLEDGEIIHSVVVIDATTVTYDAIEVLINDVIVADYLPYIWNNMLEPVGTYNITVKGYIGDNSKQATKIVEIPEVFVVPIDYEFREDFVVHTGQNVTFENGNWSVSSDNYMNGMTPIDERIYYAMNVFGTLIINNASITSRVATCENDGSIYALQNSSFNVVEFSNQKMYDDNNRNNYYDLGDVRLIRFDDNACLYYDDSCYLYSADGSFDDYIITLVNTSGTIKCVFNDNSYYYMI